MEENLGDDKSMSFAHGFALFSRHQCSQRDCKPCVACKEVVSGDSSDVKA